MGHGAALHGPRAARARPPRRGGDRVQETSAALAALRHDAFYLACVYARRGRYEEARRLWNELIAINPAFSIEHYRRTLPYADPTTFDRVIEPLKDAGIAA